MNFEYRNTDTLSVEIDDDSVIAEIAGKYDPEDVFDDKKLEEWAENNGYVKSEE